MKIHFFCFSLLSLLVVSTATDIIPISQSIQDGETLISAGGSFELGFFSPGASTKRYLGIWYKKISTRTVVWVANKEIPLLDSAGVLMLNDRGILVLLHHNKTIWFSNSSRSALNPPVAQLLESGNLVIRDGNDENPDDYNWKSFDYPCDTLLPGMKIGISTFTGQEWHLKAWQSADDPSQSNFTYSLDLHGFPQLIVRKGSGVKFCSGPLNGLTSMNSATNLIYTFNFVRNERETYYTYELINSSIVTRLVLNPNGILQRLIWIDRTHEWGLLRATPADNCDNFAFCGAYGSCNVGKPLAFECMKGFVPKSKKEWDIADWSNGCVRRTPLNCLGGDGFIKYSGVKLPDSRNSWFNESMTLDECKLACLMNCSCMAYSSLDTSTEGGSVCLLWFGDLINIREITQNGQQIYIRMAASELDHVGFNWKIPVISLSVGMVLLALSLALYLWIKKKKKKSTPQGESAEDLDLPLYDIPTLANATNNFSDDNKVGQGGYGTVYKGMLENGKEIAVKRLSVNSTQGLGEFKSEVTYITQLQHRNLVTLHGCCIQEGEKMLIYEYCPNKSLDFYIFDRTQRILLDWPKRFMIINGTAHGILYLHRDSKLRVIHRDIKVDNILLDNEMNPKISDFGLARSFNGNETEANTSTLIGTRGYISPEYALEGLYSEKSDVFSFGVLLLEVVSGKRNRIRHPKNGLNLIEHAWRLYTENRPLELVDASIRDSCIEFEVLRSIHVGLLCVQTCPKDRPPMSEVIVMLGSWEGALSRPNQPDFFIERNRFEADSLSRGHLLRSINGLTITKLEGR